MMAAAPIVQPFSGEEKETGNARPSFVHRMAQDPAVSCLRFFLCESIEGQVELQHVHARLAEDPECASFRICGDNLPHLVFGETADPRDTGNLELSSSGTDVWIKPTC